jgi:hypothetical protein
MVSWLQMWRKRYALSTWASYISEDHYEMELAALNHVPHDVSIALNSIQLVTEEKLSFELDATN